ncbi:YceI family protein [Sediminibacterium sp.]|uniref:YceI family protein n=1 Tax=Sediminibacterium sp. TaxID=1917865 RepID=UPI00271B698A|nr:YceI family protein [Sediminibacterium sp.]MDO9000408.1 YceI family protein [Bacteroidota bacterium]MDP3147024.1 YceI family protein [Bacteroidota bacterium]MDP3567439.1 YceI family protein [Sediminibacterium sp.]
MKNLLFVAALFLSLSGFSQIFKAKDGTTLIHFYSKSPLEDIDASNKGAIIVLNTTSGDIQVRVTIQNFKFKNGLMEEHFNENYLESTKFPNCVFKGKINEKVDFTKDGENKVSVTGKMELHGVTKEVTLDGMLTKKGSEIIIDTKFQIKVADYDIKVPSLYVKNIAEIVDVTLTSTLEPFVKK